MKKTLNNFLIKMRHIIKYLIISSLLFLIQSSLFAQKDRDSTILTDTTILMDAITVEAYHITGRLRTLTGSLSVLVGDNISLADGTSLAVSLNTLPGVTMQNGTYATNRIVIRGMGSRTPYNTNRIRSYLNDIPITSSDGISNPEEIDLLALGRIEVIKGPASAMYGSGLGGSINLYTPQSTSNNLNSIVQYGDFQTMKANVSGTLNGDKSSIWTSLNHFQSNGYRENNHHYNTSMLSTVNWGHKDWRIGATLHLLNVDAGIPSSISKTQFIESPQKAAANWLAIGGYKSYKKGLLGLSISRKLNQHATNKLIVFGRFSDSFEKRPFNNLNDGSNTIGIRNKFTYHTIRTDLVLGTEIIIDTYSWEIELDIIRQIKNSERRNLYNIFGLIHHRLSEKLIASVALAASYNMYELTKIFPANNNSSNSRNFPIILSPRFGVNYSPNNHLAIYSSVGHGFSLPSPEETLLPEGDVNPNIEPEQGWQFEIGSRFTSKSKSLNVDLTFYWIELNNLILTKRITEDIFTGINAGVTRHQGVEFLVLNRLFKLDRFPGKLSTTIGYYQSLNRFINFTDDGNKYDGNILPGIPSQTFQLLINWNPFKQIVVSVHLQQHGYQYLNDSNTEKYSGYFLGSTRILFPIDLKMRSNLTVFAGVNNFTNTHYASMVVPNAIGFGGSEPRYYYPGLPRHVYVGLKLAF
jgi:iron complex outermembrane receptor protein